MINFILSHPKCLKQHAAFRQNCFFRKITNITDITLIECKNASKQGKIIVIIKIKVIISSMKELRRCRSSPLLSKEHWRWLCYLDVLWSAATSYAMTRRYRLRPRCCSRHVALRQTPNRLPSFTSVIEYCYSLSSACLLPTKQTTLGKPTWAL